MRLLFCIFTFWGVCNGVRADSEPTGVVSSAHETAVTCCQLDTWLEGTWELSLSPLKNTEGTRPKLVQSHPHCVLGAVLGRVEFFLKSTWVFPGRELAWIFPNAFGRPELAP